MRHSLRATLALGSLLAVACQDSSEPVAPSDAAPDLRTTVQQPVGDPNAIGRASVAGFGGFYLDASGVPTVRLTDPGQRAAAARALGPWLAAEGLDAAGLKVVAAQFTYAQLDAWFASASTAAMALPGAVFADLDEAGNRLRIGVENAAAAAGVRAALTARGVPSSAVVVEQTPSIRYMATLQSKIRPVQGGLQINFSQFLCSVGFNALKGTTRSFVTASHCTDKQGGVENTKYYQPLAPAFGGTSEVIATEVADPGYFKGGVCPAGRRCRYSDASRAAYSSGTTYALGKIEKTTGVNNNSITLASTSFTIGSIGNGVVGNTANKVGRTTGWTQGKIAATCVTTNVSGSSVTLLCQNFVNAKVGGGDSGSPVFLGSGSTLSTVALAGVLWGGNNTGTMFVYSPMSGVQRAGELGALTVR